MVSYISELRHVCLFLGEIMCSLCVLNELLESFSLHHGCIKVDGSANNTCQDLDYSRYHKNLSNDSPVSNSSWLLTKKHSVKIHLYRVSLNQDKYIHKFQFEEVQCTTVSIV